MKLSELKEQLFPNWNWTDKFLAECLEEFLVKVNSGKILPTNKNFDDYVNYRIEESEMCRIDLSCGL